MKQYNLLYHSERYPSIYFALYEQHSTKYHMQFMEIFQFVSSLLSFGLPYPFPYPVFLFCFESRRIVIPFGIVMITHHRFFLHLQFCTFIELSTFIELWRQSNPVHLINFVSDWYFVCDLCSPSQDSFLPTIWRKMSFWFIFEFSLWIGEIFNLSNRIPNPMELHECIACVKGIGTNVLKRQFDSEF